MLPGRRGDAAGRDVWPTPLAESAAYGQARQGSTAARRDAHTGVQAVGVGAAMATYGLVVALAVLSCFVGFALQITRGNLVHLRNGRQPNARAALFPDIPCVPLTYAVATWALERIHPGLGLAIVVAYALASIAVRAVQLRRARALFSHALKYNNPSIQ